MSAAAPLFVAPHPDDVALSCGGTVAMLARTAAPIVVSVFAGAPGGEASDFARMQHERWGVRADEVSARRRDEDRCAARELGERVAPRWLDFLDAIYRDTRYDSDDALFGELLPEDLPTIDALVSALEPLVAGEVFVPLGVGNHVDHQLAFRAGRRLAARGATVWAYADLPYALGKSARSLTERLAMGTVREVRVTPVDEDAWQRRCRAIDCYASQLPVLFRDHGDHRVALDGYLRATGGGARAEAAWRVLPSRQGGR